MGCELGESIGEGMATASECLICLDELIVFEGRDTIDWCDHGEIVAHHTEFVELVELVELAELVDRCLGPLIKNADGGFVRFLLMRITACN